MSAVPKLALYVQVHVHVIYCVHCAGSFVHVLLVNLGLRCWWCNLRFCVYSMYVTS